MSNCACQSCNDPTSTSGVCPDVTCSVESLDGRDTECGIKSLKAKESSLVSSIKDSFRAADGSEDDLINLKYLKSLLSGKSVLSLDSAGNLGQIIAELGDDGKFLGVLNGKVQLLNLASSMLSYPSNSVGSLNTGRLAVFGCGPNGTLMLKMLDIPNCTIGTDGDGNAICKTPKVCLTNSDDIVADTNYLVALNSDGCLGKLAIPNVDGKCYKIQIVAGRLSVVEDLGSAVFVNDVSVVNRTDISSNVTAEVDLTSHIPAGFGCAKSVQLRVRGLVQAASRVAAAGFVSIQGYRAGELNSTWYSFGYENHFLQVPLSAGNKITYTFERTGSHNIPSHLSINIVSFHR